MYNAEILDTAVRMTVKYGYNPYDSQGTVQNNYDILSGMDEFLEETQEISND
jgi:hypothetical protein